MQATMENTSYELAAGWVAEQINALECENNGYGGCVTVSKMNDCDCIPLTVDVAGHRWYFVGSSVKALSVEAIYRLGSRRPLNPFELQNA